MELDLKISQADDGNVVLTVSILLFGLMWAIRSQPQDKNELLEIVVTCVFGVILFVDRELKFQQLYMPLVPLLFELTNAPRSITCWLYSALFPKLASQRIYADNL
jgi:hypothetical protein